VQCRENGIQLVLQISTYRSPESRLRWSSGISHSIDQKDQSVQSWRRSIGCEFGVFLFQLVFTNFRRGNGIVIVGAGLAVIGLTWWVFFSMLS
jgi:hypothetical protein